MNWGQYGRLLKHENLVADDHLPEPARGEMSWSMQALSLFGAWLAALFVLAAIGSVAWPLIAHPGARCVTGALICAGVAFWCRRHADPGIFRAQFLTAISLAGAALLLSALIEGTSSWSSWPAVALAGAIVSAILWFANPDPLHRVYMAWSVVFNAVLVLLGWRVPALAIFVLAAATAALWLTQTHWIGRGRAAAVTPFAHACSVALLIAPLGAVRGEVWDLIDDLPGHVWSYGSGPISAGLCGVLAATIIVVARTWRLDTMPMAAALATGLAVSAASWRMPGLVASLLVWVLGTAAGRPELRGVSLFGALGYLTWLYYSLETTLLIKGRSLIVVGLLLLAVVVIGRFVAPPPARAGARPARRDHG